MLRPYIEGVPDLVDREYPVQMVGHHDEVVQRDVREVPRDLKPTRGRHLPCSVEDLCSPDDVAKHGVAALHADRDEVNACT
jgi:hypothetical protein